MDKVRTPGLDALLDGCDTLMLDMDGTLLDLAFDNYMWMEHIPAEYARRNDLTEEQARDDLYAAFRRLEGKLDWYCLDHWSELLDLDIARLHREQNERIAYLPGARRFLETVARHEMRLLLVSNSHQTTLAIKNEITGVTDFFDDVYLSHDVGHAKEDQPFWRALHDNESFDFERTCFVDDNLVVLESAATFGLTRLVNITRPDTRRPPRDNCEFVGVGGVADLIS